MIEKIHGVSFPAVIFGFSEEEWILIESQACLMVPDEVKTRVTELVNLYTMDISKHDYAVKADRARRVLEKLKPIFESAERELNKFTDVNADLSSVQEEMDRYGRASPEGIMTALKALENLPLKTGERDKAYLSARDTIRGEALREYNVHLNFDDVYMAMSIISTCTKRALENLPARQAKDGDPFLNQLIRNLSSCFNDAGGVGVYTENSVGFIKEVCRIVANKIEFHLSSRIVYTIRNLTKDQIKQRLNDALRERSGKGR